MGTADSGLRAQPGHETAPDAPRLWGEILEYLRMRVSREGFETWLSPTRGRAIRNNVIEVEVPNSFFADWIGQHYTPEIRAALNQLTGHDITVSFKAADAVEAPVVVRREPPARPTRYKPDGYKLQARYTFDSFVLGESNRFAAAAAKSVAERPGTNYNPLFIYGGVGLGKTHLVQAIGNLALQLKPGLKVYYTAAEALFLEFISAIEKNTRVEFKAKYRTLDLLLLDDIHYLIGKDRLQEEVFYIFNSLHDSGSQIVFTSDRPPQDIPTLESRLASRLGSGLVVDIQQPDLETRLAILKQKAAAEHAELPNDVAYFIASRVRSSVRALEGCLVRILALSSLTGRPLSVELTQDALKDLIKEDEPVDHRAIIKATAEHFGVSLHDITNGGRTKQLALARQVAMYIIRKTLNLSLKEIGLLFDGKDHTTVMHALAKVEEIRVKDPSFANRLEKLTRGVSRGEPR
jgi:chromosomal replication initiator protein